MTAVPGGWGKRVAAASKKTDELGVETDARNVRFAVTLARLNAASDRAEAAAVAFIQEHQNVMDMAARARQRSAAMKKAGEPSENKNVRP